MADYVYWKTIDYLLRNGGLHTADLRAILVMTNTTTSAESDVEFLSDFSTLDECDSGDYARQDLANVVLAVDPSNDRTILTSDPAYFGSLNIGGSTRSNDALLLYLHFGADSVNRPLRRIDTLASGPAFPYVMNGAVVSYTPPAGGWLVGRSA